MMDFFFVPRVSPTLAIRALGRRRNDRRNVVARPGRAELIGAFLASPRSISTTARKLVVVINDSGG